MPCLTIDGKPAEVAAGTTLMDAARAIGVEIPGLCHVEGVRPLTSCMVCSVKETTGGRLMPSCTAMAEDGMVIDTRCEDVAAGRRDILSLLLSEHAGDCEAPCRHICPAFLDISGMMRRIAVGDFEDAGRIAREHLTLPATLGYVCSAPCERGCHRASRDSALRIRELHRRIGEEALASAPPPVGAPTGKRVAIVGASATGLAAAYILRGKGHDCAVIDKSDVLGRMIREYAEEEFDPRVLDAEIEVIHRMGAEFTRGREVGQDLSIEELRRAHDAVIITCDGIDAEDEGVFFAVEYVMAINAVAEGKAAAEQAHRFVQGLPAQRPRRTFNSRLGPLRGHELTAYLSRCDPSETPKHELLGMLLRTIYTRTAPATKKATGHLSPDHYQAEAARCLHCECLKPVTCRLRRYADECGADQTAFRCSERPDVEPTQRFADVVFEPGKCIKCGLCVEIGRESGQPLGLGFIGRGYSVRVGVPFERSLEEALKFDAARCITACPTGALAYRQGEQDGT